MLPYHGKKVEVFWCPREGKIARKLKHLLPPSVKVGRNLTLFVFSVKFRPKFEYSLLRGYPHRERLVDGRFPSIVKIRKVDLVSSVLCGRDFFIFLIIIICLDHGAGHPSRRRFEVEAHKSLKNWEFGDPFHQARWPKVAGAVIEARDYLE